MQVKYGCEQASRLGSFARDKFKIGLGYEN